METLGAGEDGDTHVVVTDVREELVVYINGMPYIRRELEMPAAAMHHAGVHARQLETLEMALKEVRFCGCGVSWTDGRGLEAPSAMLQCHCWV